MASKIDVLSLDEGAVHALTSVYIEADWFANPIINGGPHALHTIDVGRLRFILSHQASEDSRLLVIDLHATQLAKRFSDPQDVFARILTLALAQFENGISLSPKWGGYHAGSRVSIYARTAAKGAKDRIYADSRPLGYSDLFLYAATDTSHDIAAIPPAYEEYRAARDRYVDALLLYAPPSEQPQSKSAVFLDSLPEGFTTGWSLDEWYASRLTQQQRTFVDKPYTGAVRLVGAAGTGKTISLIMKLLHDARGFQSDGAFYRLALITHSGATAELARTIGHSLAPDLFSFPPSNVTIRIGTLYELANEVLAVEYRDINAIDLDARKGRIMQYELVRSLVDQHRLTLATLFGDECGEQFTGRLLSDVESRKDILVKDILVKEILNEFGTVLEPEGIRLGNRRAEDYIAGKRNEWLLHFRGPGERRVILEFHRHYRDLLQQMDAISVDQLIADYLSFLDSNQWDNTINRDGFDAIFVDELHLFNRIERMIFPELIREKGPFAGRRPVFMAYDLRQSERDYFSGQSPDDIRSGSWIGTEFGASELVELFDVFRFTPAIAGFLEDLSESFSTFEFFRDLRLDLKTDTDAEAAQPTLRVFDDNTSLYNWTFSEARRAARTAASGRRVAVLCMNDGLFETYANAGQYKGAFIALESRDSLEAIRFAGKRFVYSAPEFVAGLQFDVVFLINMDEGIRAELNESPLLRRQYVSRAYLAASRAAKLLTICCSRSGGGPSEVLKPCLEKGSLVAVS